ncbi:MAG: hypothetical protein KDK05_32170, partial [Candidatus Competibacteraceae bacterium]|nr:hypothetical protein [Candidatus Competibacteraceae bacterium]
MQQMNDIQRKAGIAIAQHGPLTTLEIARKIGIGSERLRKHLETEWFDFRWAIDRSYRRKVWFLRGDEPPEAGTINGEKSRLFTRWELTATEYKILRIIVD